MLKHYLSSEMNNVCILDGQIFRQTEKQNPIITKHVSNKLCRESCSENLSGNLACDDGSDGEHGDFEQPNTICTFFDIRKVQNSS